MTVLGLFSPVRAAADDDLVSSLARELAPLVRTLQNETLVFNYAPRSGDLMGVEDAHDPRALEHVRRVISLAGTASTKLTTFGPGFYVAVDPYVSRMYGGSDFALFAVRLRAGFRYVQLDDQERYSQPFIQAMEARGCRMMSPYLKRQSLSLAFKSPRCFGLVKGAFRRLRLGGLAYPFLAAQPAGCGGTQQLALLLIESEKIMEDDVVLLTRKVEAEDTVAGQLQRRIQAVTPTEGSPVWGSLRGAADGKAWARSVLWNCRPTVPDSSPK